LEYKDRSAWRGLSTGLDSKNPNYGLNSHTLVNIPKFLDHVKDNVKNRDPAADQSYTNK
jgi:hypothetical protein